MASCGEVDHSVDALASGKKVGGDSVAPGGGSGSGSGSSPSPSSPALPVLECAICLQSCVHPVRLPCRHVFCFLCVKGASWHSKRCALCRQEVPEDFLERPTLLSPEELKATATGGRGTGAGDRHAWYYEGRNGWWQYDERTSRELEDAYNKGKKSAEMLIAGFLYVADLENMVQYRRNEHGRRRRMKRDVVDIPKKGVAGLRLDPEPGGAGADTAAAAAIAQPAPAVTPSVANATDAGTPERESSADGADAGVNGGRPQPGFAAPPVRPPTMLGAHSASSSSVPVNLVQALSHLSLGRGGATADAEEDEEEVEEEDGEEEGDADDEEDDSAAPDASGYESESATSDDEDEEGDEGRTEGRQRTMTTTVTTPPDRPTPGGEGGVRSRSPDGQCTVTEV